MKETELAQKFIDYFSDFEIYKEVLSNAGCCDIVVKDHHIITAIEVKTCFNFKVVEQAISNKRCYHYSYVATPTNPNRIQEMICDKFGIGILVYDKECYWEPVYEKLRAVFNRKIKQPKLEEYMKRSVAGSQHERITKFSNTVDEIKNFLKRSGPIKLSELFTKTMKYHWSSHHSARNCFTEYVRRKIIKGIEIKDGVVYLI
jgi:hypothetical protein